MIKLSAGNLELQLLPEVGAGIAAFRYRHQGRQIDLMRPSPGGVTPPSASDTNFLLAPYSNRIRNGEFQFDGETYQLANREKHAIHGDLRNQAFKVESQDSENVRLVLETSELEQFNYPFRLGFVVEYRLSQASLSWTLEIINRDSKAAPVGGGYHPYFPRSLTEAPSDEEVEIGFAAKGIYLYEPGMPIPVDGAVKLPQGYDFSSRKPLREGIDHCYAEWQRSAVLYWPKTGITLNIEAGALLTHLVLYTPPGGRYFAVEPVSNATDAFNLAAKGVSGVGMMILEPGRSCVFDMTLAIESDR